MHGVSRVCVGTCSAQAFEPEKELVGDSIRNGAMRFGVALNLWAKGDWTLDAPESPGGVERPPSPAVAAPMPGSGADTDGPVSAPPSPDLRPVVEAARRQMTAAQKAQIRAVMANNQIKSLAAATPAELELLADECERVLNEGEPS
jgi:hypothetical protein